jgi:putative flippase GtrA
LKKLIKKFAEQIRFVIVGGLNTVIDFGILFTLVALGLPAIASNFVSTSVAMVFSFFVNKSYTFKDNKKSTGKHVVYFLVITIFGLWVIQPVIIESVTLLLQPLLKTGFLVLFIGKGLATVASLTWNYLMYRKFVFVKSNA